MTHINQTCITMKTIIDNFNTNNTMRDITVKVSSIKNYEDICFNQIGELSPLTKVIANTLFSCGICSLHSADDLQEYSYRLALLLKKKDILDNFFLNDYFFVVNLDHRLYPVTTQDIITFFGITILEHPTIITRSDYVESIGKHMMNFDLMLGLCNALDNDYCGKVDTLEVTEVDKANAEVLSATIMKEFPVEIIDQWRSNNQEAIQDFQNRLNSDGFDLKYDINNIPDSIIQKIYDSIDEVYGLEFIESEQLSQLVFLGWLNANDHTQFGSFGLEIKPPYCDYFEIQLFEHPDGDGLMLIDQVFSEYQISSFSHLLKEENLM
ncbi:MAG: hypothetical protein COC01_02780 [Bacteroidetes bacterium]|nr:MAG: hypothetical protein COC01_02780 [Bacteroidota bacterium]